MKKTEIDCGEWFIRSVEFLDEGELVKWYLVDEDVVSYVRAVLDVDRWVHPPWSKRSRRSERLVVFRCFKGKLRAYWVPTSSGWHSAQAILDECELLKEDPESRESEDKDSEDDTDMKVDQSGTGCALSTR